MLDMLKVGNLLTTHHYKFEFYPKIFDTGTWMVFKRFDNMLTSISAMLEDISWDEIMKEKNIDVDVFDDYVDIVLKDFNSVLRLENDVYYTFSIGSDYSEQYKNGKAFYIHILGYFYSDRFNVWYDFIKNNKVNKINIDELIKIIELEDFFYPRYINQKTYEKFVKLLSYVDDHFFKGLDIHHVNRSALLMLFKSLGVERFLNIYNIIPWRLDEYFYGIDLTMFDYDDAVYLYGILKNHIEELEDKGIKIIIPKFIEKE